MSSGGIPPAALGDRALFPHLTARAYLAHAAISPPSLAVEAAILTTLDVAAKRGVQAFNTFEAERERLRSALAAMIGAAPTEVALTPNTTRGVSDVALSVPWQSGQRIVLFDGEFPTNVTPWQRAAELYQLETVFHSLSGYGDGSGDGLALLEAELKRGVRMVCVSAVQFRTGLAMPISDMAKLCARYGAELFVDGIQGCGAVELPLATWGVRYAAVGGHKWLMGPEGTGFVYVASECAKRLRHPVAGWLSHEDPAEFLFRGPGHLRYDRPFKADARVFEGGGLNLYGFAGLAASVGLIEQLGVAHIFQHANVYLDALEPGLVALGFRSHRARPCSGRSCILSVDAPTGTDPLFLASELARQGVVVSVPDGLIRFAPHWPNGLDEVDVVLGATEQAIRQLR